MDIDSSVSSPRSGGDGPVHPWLVINPTLFSPLRRGWSQLPKHIYVKKLVLPAQAGMVPRGRNTVNQMQSSPRSGGDGPLGLRFTGTNIAVLPAQAGMVPSNQRLTGIPGGSPRSGGDGPGRASPCWL